MPAAIATLAGNIADLLLDVIFLVDPAGTIVDVSAGCQQLLGYSTDELKGRHLLDFVAEEDRQRTRDEAARVQAGIERVGFENRYRRRDGSLVDIMWSARRIDALDLRIGVARDITARKQAERRQATLYAISEAAHQAPDLPSLCARIHTVLDEQVGVAGMAVVTGDAAGRCRTIYQAGFDGTCPPGGAAHWRKTPLTDAYVKLELRGQHGIDGALLLHSRGDAPYSALDCELLQFTAGQIGMALERKRLQDELIRHACHDELTGLPNRYLFFDRVNIALARAHRSGTPMGLLYVDVDDFKQVNDVHGHAAGDLLLREVAARLTRCARQSDTVARLGGDEFVLVLEQLGAPEDAGRIARQLAAEMEAPMLLGNCQLNIRISIGSAVFPDDGVQIEDLLKHADIDMYRQKRERKAAAGGEAAAPLVAAA
ncbi:diguanylate cyclase domain-containing protein [Massilia aerilata]|uniref:Diguanylate cyclase domain-containing protein n=1 Tax=Massilia aerilata TaxID=453817 RepID=A0ABW0RUC2_9BURK